LCIVVISDSFLHLLKQDEGNGQMNEEEDDGGSTSSSEDEIISMCRKNLKMVQNFIVQMVPILGMYSDNYFVKLSRRVAGESDLQWIQRTLARDSSCYKMFSLRDLYLIGCIILWLSHMGCSQHHKYHL
jgi:hypothetical protein